MRARVRDELQKLLGDRVRFDVPLARLTSLRVGGPVEAVAAPAHRDELLSLLQTCSELQIPQRVLGSGFNVLAPDEGLPGVVIRLTRFRELETLPAGLRAEAGAGLENLLAVGGDHHVADTGTIHDPLPDMLDEVFAGLTRQDLSGEPPGAQAGWNNDRGCPLRSAHATISRQE